MLVTSEIVKEASLAVQEIFKSFPEGNDRFTKAIKLVQQCNSIGVQAELGKSDLHLVQIAAFFFYTAMPFEQNIQLAVDNADNFLKSKEIDQEQIASVKEALLAIMPPQMPMSGVAQVFCDAVNSLFLEKAKDLLVDIPDDILALLGQKRLASEVKYQYNYVNEIKFFTPAARKIFEKPLRKKTTWLAERLAEEKALQQNDGQSNTNNPFYGGFGFDSDRPALARGIETMFKVASREHSSLLAIVHQKAGFLASINAIILSVIISVLSTKLQENMHLAIPTVMLMLTSLGTIYFAVVATRPLTINKPTGDFNHTNQNILFFGHYTHIDWETYCSELKKVALDSNELFEILSKNIYYQGHVLKKKYNILATGYNYFIGGLAASVVAFIISFFSVA